MSRTAVHVPPQISAINKRHVFESSGSRCHDRRAILCLEMRNSKDTVSNAVGRTLVETFSELGLIILNGCSVSDDAGEFTYLGARGSSVIDICGVSVNILDEVLDFEVLPQVYSDHMPIVLTFKGDIQGEDYMPLSLLPRLVWTNAGKKVYNDKLKDLLSGYSHAADIDSKESFITDCIRKAAGRSGAPVNNRDFPKFVSKKPWFDRDCLSMRCKSFAFLKSFRSNGSDIIKQFYLVVNRQYKQLCESKAREFQRDVGRRLAEVTNPKEYWAIVATFKSKGILVDTHIEGSVWFEHFRSLLNPSAEIGTIEYARPLVETESLDRPFEIEELRRVLGKAKDNKAPGPDQIPYEFFKGMEDPKDLAKLFQ